ncbi:MAG: MFS transporter [Acetobacteraceae bacterium]
MPAPSCQYSLNSLNFFVAAAQTGFGPFVAVWLTRQGWDDGQIGIALSIGTGIALLGQVPGGMLVDAFPRKRPVTAIALGLLLVSALMLAVPATWPSIWGAQALHAIASVVITPAIAAITLSICGHDGFSERLGINARWASVGNAAAGGLLGVVAYYSSEQEVFVATAMLVGPALLALMMMRLPDMPTAPPPPGVAAATTGEPVRPSQIFREPALHVFAFCAVLFHLSNAAMLPLALNALAQKTTETDFAVSATIIVPQIVVIAFAPLAGVMAQRFGRRPILLIGFLALPARAMLFATDPNPSMLVAIQALDGVSATVFGLMMPLIAADLTRKTGHLNLAIGSIGLAAGIGATISTTAAGLISDHFGLDTAFYALAAIGFLATAIVVLLMPETRPGSLPQTPTAALAD